MRCAECGYKISDRPVKRHGNVYCSIECAESAAEVDYEDADLALNKNQDDDDDDSYLEDDDNRYALEDEDDR